MEAREELVRQAVGYVVYRMGPNSLPFSLLLQGAYKVFLFYLTIFG